MLALSEFYWQKGLTFIDQLWYLKSVNSVQHSSQQFNGTSNYHVEVRGSEIPNAGRGVWSTHYISKNEYITGYPIAGWIYKGQEIVMNDELSFGLSHAQRYSTDYLSIGLMEYQPFGNSFIQHPALCGHLMNDRGWEGNAMSEQQYEAKASQENNACLCCLNETLLVVQALRDIQPNEEITVTYGYDYWRL